MSMHIDGKWKNASDCPKTVDGKCPKCKGEVEFGYGFTGGYGLGTYNWCYECAIFLDFCEDTEGDEGSQKKHFTRIERRKRMTRIERSVKTLRRLVQSEADKGCVALLRIPFKAFEEFVEETNNMVPVDTFKLENTK